MIWSESIAPLKEFCLTDRFQYLQDTLLDKPVHNCGDTQWASFSVVLWDFHSADGVWNIPVQLPLDVVNQGWFFPLVQIAYCFVIHTCRFTAAVLPHVPICQLDIFRPAYKLH